MPPMECGEVGTPHGRAPASGGGNWPVIGRISLFAHGLGREGATVLAG